MSQGTKEQDKNHEYAIALIFSALTELASDVGVRFDFDPEYLVIRALLVSSLKINAYGTNKIVHEQSEEYQWLFDLLKTEVRQ